MELFNTLLDLMAIGDDSRSHDSSSHIGPGINPATGLPMIGNRGGIGGCDFGSSFDSGDW